MIGGQMEVRGLKVGAGSRADRSLKVPGVSFGRVGWINRHDHEGIVTIQSACGCCFPWPLSGQISPESSTRLGPTSLITSLKGDINRDGEA